MPTSEISCVGTPISNKAKSKRLKPSMPKRFMNVWPSARLADAVTDLVHGVEERHAAEAAASALFGRGELSDLTASQIEALAQEVPGSALDADQSRELATEGLDLVDLLPTTSLAQSRREAREFVGNGAISCNGIKLGKDDRLTTEHRLHGRWLLLRRGRKNWHALDAADLT